MKRSSAAGVLFGVIILIFGCLELFKGFLNWNLGFIFANWWSILIIVVAILSIVHTGFRFWNVIFLLFGGFALVGRFGFFGRHISFLALVIILLGIWIICQAASHTHHKIDGYANKDGNDYPEYASVFSTHFVSNMSKSFKGGHASSVFGHLTVDLTEIGIQGIAVIDASAVFGTLEIRMPQRHSIPNSGNAGLWFFYKQSADKSTCKWQSVH